MWSCLDRLWTLLPLSVGNHAFGFELPLGIEVGAADFCFSVRSNGSLAGELARGGPAVPPSHALAISRYLVSHGGANPLLGCLLFEYDSYGQRYTPGLFALPFRSLSFGAPGVVMNLLRVVGHGATVAQQRRVGALLGRGLDVSSFGFFPGRVPPTVRLNIPVFRLDDLPGQLGLLGWVGRSDRVCKLLASLSGRFSYQVGVDLDPWGRIGDRLGVEVHLAVEDRSVVGGGWQVSNPIVWEPLVDALAARGYCVPGKRSPLLLLHGRWEVATACGAQRLEGGLNHVKVSFSCKGVSAKAYPAFSMWTAAGR